MWQDIGLGRGDRHYARWQPLAMPVTSAGCDIAGTSQNGLESVRLWSPISWYLDGVVLTIVCLYMHIHFIHTYTTLYNHTQIVRCIMFA
jgi:hypothetical protein